MALIQCKECQHEVSDRAKICPHCGIKLIEDTKKLMTCEECGMELSEWVMSCPNCGCPVEKPKESTGTQTKLATRHIINVGAWEKFSKKKKRAIFLGIAVLVILIGFFVIKNEVLYGDDKVAYEIVLEAAKQFKNPSSVRLVSGSLGVDKDCMFCGLSATNGFGARSTSYYFIDGGIVYEEDNPLSMYKSTDSLNVKKINKKLEKALGSY